MNQPIFKNGVRILTPREYRIIRGELREHHRIVFDALLFSGMRIAELWRLADNPSWYDGDRGNINIPKGSIMKEKARQKERTVRLNLLGQRAIERFISDTPRKISTRGFNDALRRAAVRSGISSTGIMLKCLRKSWISWLMATYPDRVAFIALSSGHDIDTMITHYLNIGFDDGETLEIRKYTEGWI